MRRMLDAAHEGCGACVLDGGDAAPKAPELRDIDLLHRASAYRLIPAATV